MFLRLFGMAREGLKELRDVNSNLSAIRELLIEERRLLEELNSGLGQVSNELGILGLANDIQHMETSIVSAIERHCCNE